jgi:hypothetical protein
MEISIGHILAVFGLVVAISDLYFPRLSIMFEKYLDVTQEHLRPTYRSISESKVILRNWAFGTWFYKLYNYFWYWVAYVLVMGFILKQLDAYRTYETVEVIGAMLALPAVLYMFLLIPITIFIYLYPLYYLLIVLLTFFVYLVERFIHLCNYIGKGKALSGIGLLMAIQGVYSLGW